MNTITISNIIGIPSQDSQYAPHGGWAYCEGNHEEVIQTHTEGKAKLDCPICGAVMTSGKWTSKHDQLLIDVDKYLRFLADNHSFDLSGIDVWMDIKEDWCVIMVDCNDTNLSGALAYHGLSEAFRFDIFTESYNLYRAMLTRVRER